MTKARALSNIRRLRCVPSRVIGLVLANNLRLSEKTLRILEDSTLEVPDIVHALLNGRLVKMERDETGETPRKYTVIGSGRSGRKVYCVGKIIGNFDEDEYLIITAHWAQRSHHAKSTE